MLFEEVMLFDNYNISNVKEKMISKEEIRKVVWNYPFLNKFLLHD